MNTHEKLTEVFCDNFVAYYRAHSTHFNIRGRNFYSDHKLLQKIYEDLQEQIDTIGELIRACGELAPETITDIVNTASLADSTTGDSAMEMLQLDLDAQEHLIEAYKDLNEIAEEEDYEDIANFAQDRIRAHKKFAWMLRSTLDSYYAESDED